MSIPFFRPEILDAEVNDVVDVLRSGWLTTGPRVREFEERFATFVGARFAVAVNSATAALHLAVEALGLRAGNGVLVPTMTFAATAEVVRYLGAEPVLVDCRREDLNLDLLDAESRLSERAGREGCARTVGMLPVHVGGLVSDLDALEGFRARHGLWLVEDAAHAFPAAWRRGPEAPWRRCGSGTAAVTCFSFYANKTITTGEGGMAVTGDEGLARRMRMMSLHGLSHDAWERYRGGNSWDYRVVAPGFKYNLTDIAAAIGIQQLARAEDMRLRRERVALAYRHGLAGVDEVELPLFPENRIHSWHLFPIRLALDRLAIGRDQFIVELKARGIGCSVHWRPLHLHPYYQETFGWRPEDFPVATYEWRRLVSLPLFPSMTEEEVDQVVAAVRQICAQHARGA